MRERSQRTEMSSKFSIKKLEFKRKQCNLQLKYPRIKEITRVKITELLNVFCMQMKSSMVFYRGLCSLSFRGLFFYFGIVAVHKGEDYCEGSGAMSVGILTALITNAVGMCFRPCVFQSHDQEAEVR